MTGIAPVNVDELVDGQKFRAFNLSLLAWSFLAMFAEGFENTALGIAVPRLVREWGVSVAAMGPMLSASLFGILAGAPLFGFLGDRYGRRWVIIVGCFVFGITTLAVVLAESVQHITILRFLTGVGMGGLMSNAVALNSEMAPRRLRARLVVLMFLGITLGGTIPGLVGGWLVPQHGWRMVFWVGGLLPLLVSAGLVFYLPESVKFLAMRPEQATRLLQTLRRMRPDLTLPDDTRFAAPVAAAARQASFAPLFLGGLAPVTLLLWLTFSVTLMANFFLNSWMAVLFEAKGLTPESAAMVTAAYQFGGAAGGLVMSVLLDRWGFMAVTAMLAGAAPVLLLIALPGLSPVVLALLVGLSGLFVLGAQFGNNAAAGIIYPTAYRSKGVGMAFAVGRTGSVLGPIVGAMLIGQKLPLIWLLSAIAAPLLLGALAAVVLAQINKRRFGSWTLDEQVPNPAG